MELETGAGECLDCGQPAVVNGDYCPTHLTADSAAFDDTQAALDVVRSIIKANAELFGQEVAIRADVLPDGNIALFKISSLLDDPDKPALVLGSPEHAVFKAQRAFLRATEKANEAKQS